ncbi:deoxycytidine monophosphate deaminase [Sporobolomyces koalae]|uniref:deoxycytidine monophosphate deaminase n=1 Tax=Sporobolomyces koalae TaxID=500713 RepID=UPI0031796283
MLICLIGLPQSGKSSLADHLVAEQGFTRVHLSTLPSLDAGSTALRFDSSNDFLDHVTRSWRKDYVTTDLVHRAKLDEFAKRPFVAVVAVDAPLGIRYKRAVAAARGAGEVAPSLEEFVETDDRLQHGALAAHASLSENDSIDSFSKLSLDSTPIKEPSRLFPTSDAPPSPTPSPAKHSPTMSRALSQIRAAPSPDPLSILLPLAVTTYHNPFSSLGPFFSLVSLSALSEQLRPTWDTYFMALASLASLRSNCMKRRVGAVLVRDKRVVSTGYNGTPRGVTNCNEGGCGRCNSNESGWGTDGALDEEDTIEDLQGAGKNLNRVGQGLDVCVCLHAEENALLEAGRERVSGGRAEAAVLYCNTCPCLTCTVKIVQCGVKEVVYSLSYSMDDASRQVMESAGVVLRQMQGVPVPV